MLNRVFEVALDVHIPFLAGDDPADRTDLKQHALEVKEIVTAEYCFTVTGKDAVQVTHCELVSQLGETAATGLFSGGIDQIERDEYFSHHEIFHHADAVHDPLFADRERFGAASAVGILEDRVQQDQEMARQ